MNNMDKKLTIDEIAKIESICFPKEEAATKESLFKRPLETDESPCLMSDGSPTRTIDR